jgi:hypothetical protein
VEVEVASEETIVEGDTQVNQIVFANGMPGVFELENQEEEDEEGFLVV